MAQLDTEGTCRRRPAGKKNPDPLAKDQSVFVDERAIEEALAKGDALGVGKPIVLVARGAGSLLPPGQQEECGCHQIAVKHEHPATNLGKAARTLWPDSAEENRHGLPEFSAGAWRQGILEAHGVERTRRKRHDPAPVSFATRLDDEHRGVTV